MGSILDDVTHEEQDLCGFEDIITPKETIKTAWQSRILGSISFLCFVPMAGRCLHLQEDWDFGLTSLARR